MFRSPGYANAHWVGLTGTGAMMMNGRPPDSGEIRDLVRHVLVHRDPIIRLPSPRKGAKR